MIHNYRERGQNQSYKPRPRLSGLAPRKKSGVSHSSTAEKIADSFLGDITDCKGRIRLNNVREYFKWRQLEEKRGRSVISKCYEEWVNCNEYLLFRVWNCMTGDKVKEFYVKCAKRGNDVYRWRLKKRLDWIDEIDYEEFFNPKDRAVRGKKTRMLFVNLTYDTSRCSILEAWINIGKEWNRWITAVRKRYGVVKHFRCFEAFQNGYPHIHAVLLFKDANFEVSYRDKQKRFRILRGVKDWFDDKWHSFVDVQACYSTGAFDYVKKYMLKVHGSEKFEKVVRVTRESALKTLSLLWLFRKQSFSLSGGMRELIHDLIRGMHNSNVIPVQLTLEGCRLFIYEVVGVYTLEELRLRGKPPPDAGKKWSFELPPVSRSECRLSPR